MVGGLLGLLRVQRHAVTVCHPPNAATMSDRSGRGGGGGLSLSRRKTTESVLPSASSVIAFSFGPSPFCGNCAAVATVPRYRQRPHRGLSVERKMKTPHASGGLSVWPLR